MNRKYLFYFFFVVLGVIFIARLFQIQVLDLSYKIAADNNATRIIRQYPPRGYIFDRHGELLVANQLAYDLMVVPRQIKDLDTAGLCMLLNINKANLEERLAKAKHYSYYKPSLFFKMISKERFVEIQAHLYKYKGFFAQKRILRNYPRTSAANVVGFIGEVTTGYIQSHPHYQMGDLMGKAGIDKSYEKELRGKAGVKYVMVDNHNRIKGSFAEGRFDTLAQPGKDVHATIDIHLQEYGEYLMHGKRGSIVAIEPSSGEILALVTNPSYDPNLLVGRERSANYGKLFADSINKPLFDRGLLAEYPPGSPFKLVNALIGLQEGVINEQTTFTCHHGFHARGLHVACHCGGGSMALRKSISKSCNNYYCTVFKRIVDHYPTGNQGVDAWSNHVKSFGLGKFLNNDLPTGRKGLVPDAAYYQRYGFKNLKALNVISMGIGQGELLVTPIQLANVAAIIANRGYYYTPHIVKKIDHKPVWNENFSMRKYTTVEAQYYDPVIDGMEMVFENGTARWYKLDSLSQCGKTGTAENPHGQDHSVFLAFAPKDNPKIAIAIIVENGYWGSRWAAPIASLMMEKYITGKTTRPHIEKRMYDGILYDEYRKQLMSQYHTDTLFIGNF